MNDPPSELAMSGATPMFLCTMFVCAVYLTHCALLIVWDTYLIDLSLWGAFCHFWPESPVESASHDEVSGSAGTRPWQSMTTQAVQPSPALSAGGLGSRLVQNHSLEPRLGNALYLCSLFFCGSVSHFVHIWT